MDESLSNLALDIMGLRYVIMRNWETMPPFGDIDFWVHPDDKHALEKFCASHLEKRWYDIRTTGDNYYPEDMGNCLLDERTKFGNWWVLNPGAHFVTLMYHQLVHKGDHRYQKLLDKLFLDQSGIVKPNEEGVGFHDPRV